MIFIKVIIAFNSNVYYNEFKKKLSIDFYKSSAYHSSLKLITTIEKLKENYVEDQI